MTQAKTYSVSVRLRRTTIEEAFVSVPITTDMWKAPDDQGRVSLDGEKVMAEALNIGSDPETVWTLEEQPKIEHHPIQKAPPYVQFPKPN
jgi:hypothetical protein